MFRNPPQADPAARPRDLRTQGARLLGDHLRHGEQTRRDAVYMIRLADLLGLPADRLDAFRRGALIPTEDEATAMEKATRVPRNSWSKP
jgi:hypothetical protein